MRLALSLLLALALHAQSERPKFSVASIKPCKDGSPPDTKRGGREETFSPGMLREDCSTVMDLIKRAYVLFANGRVNPRSRIPVEGGPAWINSALYQIDAKTDGARSQGMMRGPMLQTLLEDRFKLKMHRETREVLAYALTVAKGGHKLHPFQEGSCVPFDISKMFEQFPPAPVPELPAGQKYCGGIDPKDGSRWMGVLATENGPNITLEVRAMSIDEFIRNSLGNLDRPVVNNTGLTGRFDFHLEYAPDDAKPAELAGDSIFTAIQRQLGLKLEPAKGTGEVLVIDRVGKPTAN